jgi:hypothetical protein
MILVSNKVVFKQNVWSFFQVIGKGLGLTVLISLWGYGFEKLEAENIIKAIFLGAFLTLLISFCISLYIDFHER